RYETPGEVGNRGDDCPRGGRDLIHHRGIAVLDARRRTGGELSAVPPRRIASDPVRLAPRGNGLHIHRVRGLRDHRADGGRGAPPGEEYPAWVFSVIGLSTLIFIL